MATYLPDRITPALQTDAQPGNNGYSEDYTPLVIDQVGPIDVGGILFMPMGKQAFAGTITFYISTDNGQTWTQDGSGVTQACRNWACDWNATTGLFTIAYLAAVSAGIQIPIRVRQYNPATQTWGANLTAGSNAATILTVRTRPNGDILVGYVAGDTIGGTERYSIGVLSGGLWSDNDLPPYEPASRMSLTPTMTAAMASTGVLYILTNWLDRDGQPGAYYYYRFSAANVFDVVSTFFVVPSNGNLTAGNMVLNEAGDYWAVPYRVGSTPGSELHLGRLLGLGAPFTAQDEATVPDTGLDYIAVFTGGAQFSGPVLASAGGFLYVTAVTQFSGGSTGQIYSFRTLAVQPLGPFTQLLLMDSADTDPAIQFPNDALVALLPSGAPGLFFNATDVTSNLYGRYTLGVPAPPPPFPTIKITLRGVKRVKCNPDLDVREVPGPLPTRGRAM